MFCDKSIYWLVCSPTPSLVPMLVIVIVDKLVYTLPYTLKIPSLYMVRPESQKFRLKVSSAMDMYFQKIIT